MLLFTVVLDGATAADMSDLLTELKILKDVNKDPHPNVLQLIGACTTAGNPHTSANWLILFLSEWYRLNDGN